VPPGDAAAELEDVVIWAGDFPASTSRGARRASFRSAATAPVLAAPSPAGEAASPALVAVDDGGPAAKWEHPSDRSIAPDTAHKRIHRGVMQAYPNPDKPEPNSKFEARNSKQIQKGIMWVQRLIATSIKQRRVGLSRIDRPRRRGRAVRPHPYI